MRLFNGIVSQAAGGGGTPEFSFLGSSSAANTTTSTTFSGVSLGTADANRYIAIAISCRSALGNAYVPTAVTVAGVSATKIVGANGTNANTTSAEIWIAAVPTGTTGDVVITSSGSLFALGVGRYRLVNYAATATDTDTSNATATHSVTTTHGTNACLIGVGYDIPTGPTATWTNLTEDYDINPSAANETTTSASASGLSSGSTNVQCAFTGGNSAYSCMATASFNPA